MKKRWGGSLEITTFIIRVGPEHKRHGDPWELAIHGMVFNGTAYLSALKGWSHKAVKAIKRELRKIGVSDVVYARREEDAYRIMEYCIGDKNEDNT